MEKIITNGVSVTFDVNINEAIIDVGESSTKIAVFPAEGSVIRVFNSAYFLLSKNIHSVVEGYLPNAPMVISTMGLFYCVYSGQVYITANRISAESWRLNILNPLTETEEE